MTLLEDLLYNKGLVLKIFKNPYRERQPNSIGKVVKDMNWQFK